MKVGIVIDKLESEVISGSHFEQAILKQVAKVNGIQNLYFFILVNEIGSGKIEVPLEIINLKNYENRINKYPNSKISKLVKLLFRFFKKILNFKALSKFTEILFESPLNLAIEQNSLDFIWNIYTNEEVNIPYIATCLDCYDLVNPYLPENNDYWNWVSWNTKASQYYRKATFIAVSTEVLKNQVMHFYGVPSDKFILNPFFTPKLNNAITTFNNIDSSRVIGNNYLFYPARYTPQKNHIVLLEALKNLKNKHGFTPQLILCGKDCGNLEYLKYKVKEFDIEDQIIFLGLVDFVHLVELYKHAKALVYCSFVGPDNLPPLEAFSYKCPVIASKVSGAEEQLKDAALLFEPTNEFELADHILTIYTDEKMVINLINKGLEVSKSLSVERYVNNITIRLEQFIKIHRAWK